MYEYEMTAPQGWICPKCGRVYSPTTIMCICCGGIEVTDHTTASIDWTKNTTTTQAGTKREWTNEER